MVDQVSRQASIAPAIRPATSDDVPAIGRIAAANDEPIVEPGATGSPYLEHIRRRGRLFVADWDGAVIGFAGAIDVGPAAHLADLFVDPPLHGRGIGRSLLEVAIPAAGERTTFSSADPRSLPIYVRAGMRPWWPALYLRGNASQLPGGGLEVAWSPVAESVALELAWSGTDRLADARYWTAEPGGSALVVRDGRAPVAVGYTADSRRGAWRVLRRLRIVPGGDPIGPVLAAIRSTAPDGPVALYLPGPHPVLAILLERGFRIVDRDTFMASRPDLVDPERFLPDPALL